MLALFAAIIVPIFLCIYMPFRWLTSQEWPWLRRALYFPIAGQARWEHATQRMRLLRRLGGVPVLLRTADERTVHAVWIEYRPPGAKHPDRAHSATDEGPCATPVALCLHANAMVLDDMIDWAQFYLTRGISVMLVTFWGYPDPDEPEADGRASPPTAAPDVERVKQLPREMEAAYSADVGMRCPSEQTMYHDAEAALRWLMDTRGASIDRTLVHGLSIGGGVAASLGVNHPGLRVTFDQTFASLAEVTLHVGTGLYEQIVLPRAPRRCHTLVRWLRPCVLRLVAFVLLRMLFKTGSSSSRIGEQDRMDNVRKAAAIKADVFAIFAEQDEMMPPTIAHRLLVARYGASADSDMIHSRQLCVPGGHCAFFADTPEHAHKYTQVRTSPLNSGAARRAPRHTPYASRKKLPAAYVRDAPRSLTPRSLTCCRVLSCSRVLTRSHAFGASLLPACSLARGSTCTHVASSNDDVAVPYCIRLGAPSLMHHTLHATDLRHLVQISRSPLQISATDLRYRSPLQISAT
jgi:hypothetical protein